MLRRNKDVPAGLVNGVMGTITGFEWPMLHRDQLKTGQVAEVVLIKFDDSTIADKYVDKVGDQIKVPL